MTELFNRHVKVTFVEPGIVVGGHIEYGAQIKHTHQIEINVTAEVNKYPNKATIKVYNLDQSQRDAIKQERITVEIEAGYVNPNGDSIIDLIYVGHTISVITSREGNNTISIAECGDGLNGYRHSKTNQSFPKSGNSPADIINKCAQDFASNGIPTRKLSDLPTDTLPRSVHAHASTRDIMDDTCRENDLEWQIVHGKLEVFKKDLISIADNPVLISAGTGMIESPRETETGITVHCLMMPKIRPGRLIAVDSKLGNGVQLYRVEKYEHIGSVYGAELKTKIHARIYNGSVKRNIERLRGQIAV